MAYELNEGQGSSFKNEFKTKGDNKPDMKGKLMHNGEIIYFACWKRTYKKKDGTEDWYFSIKVDEDHILEERPKITDDELKVLADSQKRAKKTQIEDIEDLPF